MDLISITLIVYFILILWFENITKFYIGLGLLIIFHLLIYYLRNPTEALVPYNLAIESLYEKKVFYSNAEKREIFPTSVLLEKNWRKIRDEFLSLTDKSYDHSCLFETTYKENNIGKRFIQQDDEFWKGWNTIELRSFDKDNENLKHCPILKSLLPDDVSTAFFSILEPGKTIPSHYGPFKGILRYHLGLIVPKGCFISVDNQVYEWKEGEGVLFDETYKHFVKNETDYYRVILFLDIRRPLTFPIINEFILWLMSISPYN